MRNHILGMKVDWKQSLNAIWLFLIQYTRPETDLFQK